MAWAKSRFEEYFNSQVELVAHLRSLLSPTTTATTTTTVASDADANTTVTVKVDRVRTWLSTLSADQLSGLLKVLQFQPWTSDGALKVSYHVLVPSTDFFFCILTHSFFLLCSVGAVGVSNTVLRRTDCLVARKPS